MWYWLIATAKPHATPQTIAAKRHQWVTQGKGQQLSAWCRTAQRYLVEGAAPAQVFWLLETDDPRPVALLRDHFGDLWEIAVCQVIPQTLSQAPPRSG